MGFLDKAKELTDKAVDRHGDKIAKGVAKAIEVHFAKRVVAK